MQARDIDCLIGVPIGALTILKDLGCTLGNKRNRYVLVRCTCGKERPMRLSRVLLGTKTCHGRVREKGEAAAWEIFKNYERKSKKMGLPFELDFPQFKQIADRKCFYCECSPANIARGYSGSRHNGSYTYSGIDRYDNNDGYTLKNSKPCCDMCNKIKRHHNTQFLFNHLEKMVMVHKRQWWHGLMKAAAYKNV